MHGSIFGCIYLFQFKFGNFGKTGKASVIKNTITKVKFNNESLCSEVKTIFALKFDYLIVTVV
jgi:hypothetical protein